jgi:hypothetical protein
MEPSPSRTRLAHRAGLALVAVPLVALAVLALVSSSSADRTGVGYITSDNVTWVRTLPEASDGVGARVVGNRLFVTTTKDLIVYDITNPTDPRRMGSFSVNIEFENEEVPTNGKLLGISGEIGGCSPAGIAPVVNSANCLAIYDVSGDAPKPVKVVPDAGDHTATCILDCTYFWGSEGAVVDSRHPANAKLVGNWSDGLKFDRSGRCHHQNEVSPGIIIAACQPIYLLSVRPEDGGSPAKPKVLATYSHADKRFVHGVRWPNGGTDKFILGGGETNAQPRCTNTVGAFMVFDATTPSARGAWTQTDEKRPQNGTYQDGNPPTQILGCSAHWFQEHQTFRNGGMVALAEYEQGTRFLQITTTGKIRQLGYFLPLGGSTSAPHWAPDGRTVYAIDYTRGLDVLRYEGPIPTGDDLPAQVTAPGETPLPESGAASARNAGAPACASNAGLDSVAISRSRLRVDRKAERPFQFSLFQQSDGRRIVSNRLVRRVRSTTRASLRLPSRAENGVYLARVTMDLPGTDDVRRMIVERIRGRWIVRPDAYLRNTCGVLSSFKLDRAVFGGPSGRSLGVSYRLPQGVDTVTIQVLRGRKVVATKRGGTTARAYRFTVPARTVAAGRDVRVRLIVERSDRRVVETLTARRL